MLLLLVLNADFDFDTSPELTFRNVWSQLVAAEDLSEEVVLDVSAAMLLLSMQLQVSSDQPCIDK